MAARTSAQLQAIIHAALGGQLDQAAAERLHAFGPEAVGIAMLAASKCIADQYKRIAEQYKRIADQYKRIAELQAAAKPTSSTPSGMIPVYAKANVSKRRKKPGGRPGHAGARRATPKRIDHRQAHRLKCCPHCRGKLQRCHRSRARIIEDIPEDIQPVVTEHTIHRDYCPKCKKHVEPVVPDAMPKATLGHQVTALTSWFHYGLGITLDQVTDILGYHLQTPL